MTTTSYERFSYLIGLVLGIGLLIWVFSTPGPQIWASMTGGWVSGHCAFKLVWP